MISCRRAISLTILLAALSSSRAQTATPAPAKVDYSQEAAILDQSSTKIAFENDGNFTREQTTRVHIQSDPGVKRWGLLVFPYQATTQTVEIDYVRVHKADGTILITPPDNVQDLDAEITRSAPFYSDLREKHVAVKGLGKGDTLEYGAHWRTTKSLIPGQFWFEYNFDHDGIVLDERVEVRVPAARAVKAKGPLATQTITTEGNFRVYTWTYSKLQNAKDPDSDQKKTLETLLGRVAPPDVQISSFQTWEEVGRWYWDLQKDRIEPTSGIRAKAAELTKGMSGDDAKLRAIYSFVSTQYRYIGIAFGIGRYQPHAADDVLTNSYGDCKDKQTLLASLLQASGITLYPALINSSRKLDSDIPSPAQFDHVVGYLPQGKEAVWLDTTPEVAPFGYLLLRLRDKQALVMSGGALIRLVTTPADPPFRETESFKIDGKLGEDGTFEAKIEDTSRGESEVILRAAFRQVAQPQWKDLVQRISYALGFAGTTSDVSASIPELTADPFRFSYSYNRKDYPDWKSDRHFTVPGMPFFLPPVRDDASYPVWLGPPAEMVSDSRVELPAGYTPQLPANVDLKYDFAEYHAAYSVDRGVLIAKRRLLGKLHEVPIAEFDDYRTFIRNLQNDLNRYVETSPFSALVTPNVPVAPSVPERPSSQLPVLVPPSLRAIRDLPESNLPEANRLEAEARAALVQHDRTGAVSSLNQAVAADPKFTRGWVLLGILLLEQKQFDEGIRAFQKAIAADPSQPAIRKALGLDLMSQQRFEDAVPVWNDLIKVRPDDGDGPANLATCLFNLQRYPEAEAVYRAALKITPDSAPLIAGLGRVFMAQKRYAEAIPILESEAAKDNSGAALYALGFAYMLAGQVEKGASALQKLVDDKPGPETWNDVAYELARNDLSLPKALEYARHAVNAQEMESHNVDLSELLPEDLMCTQQIGFFWDTLGWVHFRLGHLDEAEHYLYAAWLLQLSRVVADHLGQVYEQQQKKEKAIHMYRMALAMPDPGLPGESADETRQRLEHLTGAKAPTATEQLRGDAIEREFNLLRTVKLKPLVSGSATAEFFLLFSPGPTVEDVKFISGSEELKSAGQALKAAKFPVAFPEQSSARLLRRVILMCSSISGCNAVLLAPDAVKSVN